MIPKCRACGSKLEDVCVDLGMSPLCQKHVQADELNHVEAFYPLKVWVCSGCWLVQLEEYVDPEKLFAHYEYFSSYSTSWIEHARKYVEMITEKLGLNDTTRVVEIASNDGYLLQHFMTRQIPCVGIEPAANVAESAREKGIETIVKFFGLQTARETAETHGKAKLILGNNVLAHVPDLLDFVSGLAALLDDDGVVTMEFPHLVRLIEENQFDTIYHEHFSYFSFFVVEQVFAKHGLRLFDVEEIPTHGGSLRIYACHEDCSLFPTEASVQSLRSNELEAGYADMNVYSEFAEKVMETKRNLLEFLINVKREGKKIVGYGAPGKGNTLLNYCGIRTDFLDFTVDRSPIKQGTFTPGTHIPILEPKEIESAKPDLVLILPWNLSKEISESASFIRTWGGKFVVPIPAVRVF
jgi:hypothetical protein